jgi:hypothetical protein
MKITLILIMMTITSVLFSETLPQPKNAQLYTEFNSKRTAPFLKKPITSSGYIVMDGKSNFLYKQTNPFNIEVRKKGSKLTFKKDKSEAITLPPTASGDNIAFLFEGDETFLENYDITKKAASNKDLYSIIPKKSEKVKEIQITGNDDKFESIKLIFNDKSEIFYEFKNTVTGTPPDEKLF